MKGNKNVRLDLGCMKGEKLVVQEVTNVQKIRLFYDTHEKGVTA